MTSFIHKQARGLALCQQMNLILEREGFEKTIHINEMARDANDRILYIGGTIRDKVESKENIDPDCQKYYVTYDPLKAYTTIGAKNVHHAFNKATKEFKGKYTRIIKANPNSNSNPDWEFLSVSEFAQLLSKVKP